MQDNTPQNGQLNFAQPNYNQQSAIPSYNQQPNYGQVYSQQGQANNDPWSNFQV